MERLIYPYLVALQTLPKVAIAPLFIIWFGYGLTSKVVITALVCFFPVLVSVIAGFHATDRDQLDMMAAFGATKWQTLMRLRVPSALVLIFAGLEVAAVLAVIGAIVGEFVGAQVGLGYLVVTLNFSMDVPGVFAVLIVFSAIGLMLHWLMRLPPADPSSGSSAAIRPSFPDPRRSSCAYNRTPTLILPWRASRLILIGADAGSPRARKGAHPYSGSHHR